MINTVTGHKIFIFFSILTELGKYSPRMYHPFQTSSKEYFPNWKIRPRDALSPYPFGDFKYGLKVQLIVLHIQTIMENKYGFSPQYLYMQLCIHPRVKIRPSRRIGHRSPFKGTVQRDGSGRN